MTYRWLDKLHLASGRYPAEARQIRICGVTRVTRYVYGTEFPSALALHTELEGFLVMLRQRHHHRRWRRNYKHID